MDFQRTSDRLNFFFSEHSWALLTDASSENAIENHLKVLSTACKHWGSKLEFPLNLSPAAFENTNEAFEYWHQKLPRLRLLHLRKQQIIIDDLYHGYNPQRANLLLRRKLKLDTNAWGHLIYFGGNRRTFVKTFQTKPEPNQLRIAVEYFHKNHVVEKLIESDSDLTQNASEFERHNELQNVTKSTADLLLAANNNQSILNIKRSRDLDRINVNYFHRHIHFLDMRVKVPLSPVCFTIYCLYLKENKGFKNSDRFDEKIKNQAIEIYEKLMGRDDNQAIENCFDPSDDKPFRDAIYKIKSKISKELGDNDFAKSYLITGKNGGIKRICIPQNMVTYDKDVF
jgi:hypothetical protein